MKTYNIRNYNELEFQKFKNKTKSNIDFNLSLYDNTFGWVRTIDNYLPILDGIVRNPRRFIQSDESIVPIEKAKKFTEESVKHLAQNTQLIQDVDKDGMPQPLKVLNVFKEETYDLYENRFIHSLVINLHYFLNYSLDQAKQLEKKVNADENIYTYRSYTETDSYEFSSKVEINLIDKSTKNRVTIDTDKIVKKIEEMYVIVTGFINTPIMKELDRAEAVRSPIRKTNAILKDPDLNKCLELWEILEGLLNNIEVEKTNYRENVVVDKEIQEGLDITSYLNYCIVSKRKSEKREFKDIESADAFSHIIKNYIRKKEITIKNFKTTIVKDFNKMCEYYVKQYDELNDIYDDLYDEYQERIYKNLL